MGLGFFLFAVALVIFAAEVVIPSGGLLTVLGLAALAWAVYQFFTVSTTAGVVSMAVSAVGVPATAIWVLNHIDLLPFGRKIAPPNPEHYRHTLGDTHGTGATSLAEMVGYTGRALSPLRPVGRCEFDGRRIQCVTEGGMIDAGAEVLAVGVQMNNLVVKRASQV